MTVVSTSAFYDRARLEIGSLRQRAERLQTAIGRGERLTRSSDDPVAAAQLRGLMRAEALAKIDTANSARAASDLGLADTALSSFAAHVTRAIELATQAASGTLSPAQRAGIGQELSQLHGNLFALANSRDSAGHALFGGETAGQAYALSGGAVTYTGTPSAGELSLGEGLTVTRGLTGPEFLSFAGTDLFTVISTLAADLQGAAADPQAAARSALGTLDAGLDAITTAQTVVGTRLAWIELTTERRAQVSEQRASEQAQLGGTDIAATITELQHAMTVLEASQASFARLASLSLFDLIR